MDQLLGVPTTRPTNISEFGSYEPIPNSEPILHLSPRMLGALGFLLAVFFSLLASTAYKSSKHTAKLADIIDPIDINTASEAEFADVPQLGKVLAGRIVQYRQKVSRFSAVEELRHVPGMASKFDKVRHFFKVSSYTNEQLPKPIVRGARPEDKPAPKTTGSKRITPIAPIDLNTARQDELQKIPGIGTVLSARIIEARETKPFTSVEDLRKVKGIGAKTLDKVRPYVRVGPAD